MNRWLVILASSLICLSCAQTQTQNNMDVPTSGADGDTLRRDGPAHGESAGQEEAPPKRILYRLTFSDDLSKGNVRICFDGLRPGRLKPGRTQYAPFVENARLVRSRGAGGALSIEGDTIHIPAGTDDDCVELTIDLAAATQSIQDWRFAARIDGELYLDPLLVLWRPDGIPSGCVARMEFLTPSGMTMSHPWAALSGGQWSIPWHALDWPGIMVIGDAKIEKVQAPGGDLMMKHLPGASPAEERLAISWLTEAAHATSTLYGAFPRAQAQVTLIPAGEGGQGAVFGLVKRGGGFGIHMLVSRPLQEEKIKEDWIAVHEMSHLFLPFTIKPEIWFSEGVATYYQNVLRARAGLLSPEEAWSNLRNGFEIGRTEYIERSLAEATEAMPREGIYLRVYWGGTALVLAADVALRQRENQASSMDIALERLADCCLKRQRYYSVEDVLRILDEQVGGDTFQRLKREMVDVPFYPDFDDMWHWLGISFENGSAIFDADAPGAQVRDAIMRAPSSSPLVH